MRQFLDYYNPPEPEPVAPPAPPRPRVRYRETPRPEPKKLATRPKMVRPGREAVRMGTNGHSVEQRFVAYFQEIPEDAPGLILNTAGEVYLVAPDGTRTLLNGGGSGLPTGWTQSGDPADVLMHGGSLTVGDNDDSFVFVGTAGVLSNGSGIGGAAFAAGNGNGATVALDAGGLDIENVSHLTGGNLIANFGSGSLTAQGVIIEAGDNGVQSEPNAGHPAFFAGDSHGATVALSAGGLAINNVGNIDIHGIATFPGGIGLVNITGDSGVTSNPEAGNPAFTALGSNGATVALDAGQLAILDVGYVSINAVGNTALAASGINVDSDGIFAALLGQPVGSGLGTHLLQGLDDAFPILTVGTKNQTAVLTLGPHGGLTLAGDGIGSVDQKVLLTTGDSFGVYDNPITNLIFGVGYIGSVPKISFFGANFAPQQPTPVTLDDVIALLQTYGLAA